MVSTELPDLREFEVSQTRLHGLTLLQAHTPILPLQSPVSSRAERSPDMIHRRRRESKEHGGVSET